MRPGISISMDNNGVRRFITNLNKAALGISSRSQQVLVRVAEQIMEESKAQVPKDTEALLDSAYIEVTTNRRSIVQVTFGYGGTQDKINPKTQKLASTYAIYVHERLDLNHPVGKAKFLEDPVNQYTQQLPIRLQTEFLSILGGVVNG